MPANNSQMSGTFSQTAPFFSQTHRIISDLRINFSDQQVLFSNQRGNFSDRSRFFSDCKIFSNQQIPPKPIHPHQLNFLTYKFAFPQIKWYNGKDFVFGGI